MTTLVGAHRQSRINAVDEIARRGDPEEIIATLRDRDPDVRARMARTLRPVTDERVIDALIDGIRRPEAWEHAVEIWDARRALRRRLPAARPRLRRALVAEPNAPDPDDVAALVREVASDDLLTDLAEGDDETLHWPATWALSHIVHPDAVPPLSRLLAATAENARSTVAESAARGLGRQGSPAAVAALVGALPAASNRQDYGDLRSAIGEAITASGAIACEPLFATLRDGDHRVRIHAAALLADIHCAGAVEPLSAALRDDPDPGVRVQAAAALQTFADPATRDVLIAQLENDHVHVRAAVPWALVALRDTSVIEHLITMMRGPGYRHRFPYSRWQLATSVKLRAKAAPRSRILGWGRCSQNARNTSATRAGQPRAALPASRDQHDHHSPRSARHRGSLSGRRFACRGEYLTRPGSGMWRRPARH